jgi:hypothetical protein
MQSTFDGVPVTIRDGGDRWFPMAAWLIATLKAEERAILAQVICAKDAIEIRATTFNPPLLESAGERLVARFHICPRLVMPCNSSEPGRLWAGAEWRPAGGPLGDSLEDFAS